MFSLIDASVERWRTVLLLLVFIFVMGLAGYSAIPKESAPDVKIPYIYVSMTHEGISPEDAERLLLRPMEKALQSIESVKEMTAQAVEGLASVTLEFEAGFNSDKALEDVRAKVDEAKPDLPEDTDEPKVVELNFSKFPILNVMLTGDVDERTLVKVSRDLRDKVENISTVLEANLVGTREEVLEILINPLVLESYQISPSEVFAKVDANNQLIPAGEVDTGSGSFAIKLPGLVETLVDLRTIPLRVDGEAVTTLQDVADIRRGFKDPQNYARVNGKRAVVLEVSKRTGANIIETAEAVRALVDKERKYWPQGIQVIYSNDQSDEIRDMLSDLQNNIILAVLLVMIVVLMVMGLRPAALVASAIPGAFLFGVLCIWGMGFTMNIVVLFSLILSIGMLVDSAIVVSEYADRLMMDGQPPQKAYPNAAKRMAWPIIASTATTLVVFMPLLFWPGIVGQFMSYMPITLIVTLAGSLLMALIFVPVIGTRMGKGSRINEKEARKIRAAEVGNLSELGAYTRGYVTWLDAALSRPKLVVGAIFAAVVGLFVAFVSAGPGVEFFPEVEPKVAMVDIRAQGNLSVDEKDAITKRVEAKIKEVEGIRTRYAQGGKISLRFDTPEDTIGRITLEFTDWDTRPPADAILTEIRDALGVIPGIQVVTQKQKEGPATDKAVVLEFSSREPSLLKPTVTDVLRGMQEIGGFINVTDDRPVPQIEWNLAVNRELAGRYDIDVSMIGQVVKMISNGIIVNTYRPDDADDEIDIITRFPREFRNLSQLDRLRVHTPDGLVPIGNYVEREAQQKVSTIRRVDGRRAMHIRADLQPGLNVDQKVSELQEWMVANAEIDPRVNIRFRGEDEEQAKAGAFLGSAFMVALFLMMLILVTQFNSLYDMAVIMSAVFLSTGGVLLGLLVTWQAFGIVMCGVAVISLAGIVVNNNIIFIDTYKLLLAGGMDRHEALLRTGAQRMRPILLTAGTTVLGLLPMVLAVTIDFVGREVSVGAPSSQWWQQLSASIAGGLAFATILTLFFTPCLLMLEGSLPNWFTRRLDSLTRLRLKLQRNMQ